MPPCPGLQAISALIITLTRAYRDTPMHQCAAFEKKQSVLETPLVKVSRCILHKDRCPQTPFSERPLIFHRRPRRRFKFASPARWRPVYQSSATLHPPAPIIFYPPPMQINASHHSHSHHTSSFLFEYISPFPSRHPPTTPSRCSPPPSPTTPPQCPPQLSPSPLRSRSAPPSPVPLPAPWASPP